MDTMTFLLSMDLYIFNDKNVHINEELYQYLFINIHNIIILNQISKLKCHKLLNEDYMKYMEFYYIYDKICIILI
jgi:hypothetical protein